MIIFDSLVHIEHIYRVPARKFRHNLLNTFTFKPEILIHPSRVHLNIHFPHVHFSIFYNRLLTRIQNRLFPIHINFDLTGSQRCFRSFVSLVTIHVKRSSQNLHRIILTLYDKRLGRIFSHLEISLPGQIYQTLLAISKTFRETKFRLCIQIHPGSISQHNLILSPSWNLDFIIPYFSHTFLQLSICKNNLFSVIFCQRSNEIDLIQ